MASEYRSGQGSIIPTMFIGIGGTGSRIVDAIAQRAKDLPNWETQLSGLTSFVAVDTNEGDQHKLQHVPEGNRINIAAFDKSQVIEGYRRAKDRRALQWLDRAYKPRAGFKPGAGQIRVESRLGFFFHSPAIRERLKQLVSDALRPNNTWRQSSPPKFHVYLYATLAGGTGSGSFLSMAYLVEQVILQQSWQPRIISNLLLSTMMVDKVGSELHGDIHANTYAALKELENLTKLDYQQIKDSGRTSEKFVYWYDENKEDGPTVSSRPFFISFVYDRPAHLSLLDVERTVADVSYLQVFTPVIVNLASEYDNYEKKLEKLTAFAGDLRNIGEGFTKNFGACGAAALVLPAKDLLEYSALRFAAEGIRGQITFGAGAQDDGGDIAAALSRLAVNYSDENFRAMGEAGRERMINTAFLDSVQEMARQDARRGRTQGYWLELVERVDQGAVTGTDDQGEPRRGESTLKRMGRLLEEARRDALNKVSIKDRAFTFHKEGVNTYVELVSRLLEDIRSARIIVDEAAKRLKTAAAAGEVVTDLKLDPIAERYTVLRLLNLVFGEWIPAAEDQRDKAKLKDVGNPAVKARLENELYEALMQAGSERSIFGGDKAFLAAREEAQEYYRAVAAAARRMFEAELNLIQLRALEDFLKTRARQYAQLAARMDKLVQELEEEAERHRRGEAGLSPAFGLRVEVFETLDEPRTRIWDRVYHALFIDQGRYLSTFDRDVLATTVAQQLKPVVRDGAVVAKSVDQTVKDLRTAFLELGRKRLGPAIEGDESGPGLDLLRGIELEARLVLQPKKKTGAEITGADLEAYEQKKFRALAQLAGVLARVNSGEAKAWGDGVVVGRTRQLIVGRTAEGAMSQAAKGFERRLQAALTTDARNVNVDHWHDARLAIVHDVELPIPLYYFTAVVGEIEDAYLAAASDERRSYNLHTDFNWEKSLSNLNPRRSEVTVGWSLKTLARALVAGVIQFQEGRWVWSVEAGEKPEDLGGTLSSALYRLGEIHRLEDLGKALEKGVADTRRALGKEELRSRAGKLKEQIGKVISRFGREEMRGDLAREDLLDRPIFHALLAELDAAGEAQTEPSRIRPDISVA